VSNEPIGAVELLAGISGPAKSLSYEHDNFGRVRVLPRANHVPARDLECGVYTQVAVFVAAELRYPVLAVARGDIPMLWAAVPEAAVYEDRYTPAREHDVGSNCEPLESEGQVYAEPQTPGV
jgi:hypothetical protein